MNSAMLLPWVALLTPLTVIAWTLGSQRAHRRWLDRWFGATLLSFAALALLDLLSRHGALDPATLTVATHVAYQLMTLGVISFLLLAVHGFRPLQLWVVGVQAVLGLALAAPLVPMTNQPSAWVIVNVSCAVVLLLTLVHALLTRRAGAPGWMVLMAALASLDVMLDDFDDAAGGVIAASWSQVLLTLILLALWLACTRSLGKRVPRDRRAPAALDRQRLAQDLHDGVGSHLTSIISALDAGSARERSTAAQLQECLVELKLLVDGMATDASLLSLMASLRYRIEPLLQTARIRMHWSVADEALLDSVRGDAARHVLNLTQEALANVLRHSGADRVEITCCMHKGEQALLLEVTDNGVGLREGSAAGLAARQLGKGLRGMQARAHQLGGQLMIESAPQRGTRVRALVPLSCLQTEEA